jgi:pimeloyl-ACP methyl ester carboxylesterase
MKSLSTLAAALLLALTGLVAIPAAPASAAGCGNSTEAGNGQAAALRPVVYVHGWTSNGSTFHDTGKWLTKHLPGKIQNYFFDYAAHATTWADNDTVAGCLATYLTDVSKAYEAVGGDGKVLVVAHSMGGLATLYAATHGDRTDVGHVADRLGGVVTFDTPYLGSPFGNRTLSGLLQGTKQQPSAVEQFLRRQSPLLSLLPEGDAVVPPAGSDAQVCLAPHSDGGQMPAGCNAALPPYLPPSVPLTEVGGDITVRRTMLGIHLYDIDLGGDGIVPATSSWGYLQIQRKNKWPKGAKNSLRTDTCTFNSETLAAALTGAAAGARGGGWGAIAGSLAGVVAQYYVDNATLDDLSSGNPRYYAAGVYMGLAQAFAGCSHVKIVNDDKARDTARDAINGYLAQLNATRVVTLEPVTASGKAAKGWAVEDLTSDNGPGPVDCSGNDASPAAPKDNVYYCSPVAAASDACWVANNRVTVLCLQDPMTKRIAMLAVETNGRPTGPAQHVDEPLPIRLDLDNGDHCRLRNGGSWGGSYPNRVGWYGCEKAQAVWGTASQGINQSTRLWTVKTGGDTGPLTRHTVKTAYFVGTAS